MPGWGGGDDPRKFDYHEVPPSKRLWIWEDDLAAATRDLALPDH